MRSNPNRGGNARFGIFFEFFSQSRNASHAKGDELCRFRLRHAKNELWGQNPHRMAVKSHSPHRVVVVRWFRLGLAVGNRHRLVGFQPPKLIVGCPEPESA